MNSNLLGWRFRFGFWRLLTAFAVFLLMFFALAQAQAQPNVSPDQAYAWGANIGWTHWRPSSIDGAQIGEFVCSGFIYSANVGWINLGGGRPANGIHYRNDSATDFGINHDQLGHLSGLAYGANIGWINFDADGKPVIDLLTGNLSGFVYGANVGWINLGDASFSLKVDSISGDADSDHDGIPDAWELIHAGNLATFGANTDFDHDGSTDLEEYLAGTDPNDPNDHLQIFEFSVNNEKGAIRLSWTTQPSRQYQIQMRPRFGGGSIWTDSGLGLQTADGPWLSKTLSIVIDPTQSFFRVQSVRPLAP